jgi:hypothetical protein
VWRTTKTVGAPFQTLYVVLITYFVVQPLAEDIKTVLKVMKSKGIRRILALSTPSYYVHPETVSEISGLITQS